MPYFKQGQWEESGEDRRFRDGLVLLLLELGFSVRTKVKNEKILRMEEQDFAKLQLNSQLNLYFNPTRSPLQVSSTTPRVELELCLIFGLYHHPPHYFSELQNQVN